MPRDRSPRFRRSAQVSRRAQRRNRGGTRAAAAVLALAALAGCTVTAPEPLPTAGGDGINLDVGPRHPFVDVGPTGVTIIEGDDWSLPEWVRPAGNSGYFSEDADASELVAVRSVDL